MSARQTELAADPQAACVIFIDCYEDGAGARLLRAFLADAIWIMPVRSIGSRCME